MYSLSDAESKTFQKFAKFPSWCGSRVDDDESLALCRIIFESRPKTVVEVGVNTGCSTAVIAWAMREVHGANLAQCQFHAFDLRDYAAAAQGRQVPIGEAVREMDPSLKKSSVSTRVRLHWMRPSIASRRASTLRLSTPLTIILGQLWI